MFLSEYSSGYRYQGQLKLFFLLALANYAAVSACQVLVVSCAHRVVSTCVVSCSHHARHTAPLHCEFLFL